VVPIVLIYRKYYGRRVTARLVAIMFATMVAAALIATASSARLISCDAPSVDPVDLRARRRVNYTTFLNIVSSRRCRALRPDALAWRAGSVCGMTVDRDKTPHRSEHAGKTVTSAARAAGRFDADPKLSRPRSRAGVDPRTAALLVEPSLDRGL